MTHEPRILKCPGLGIVIEYAVGRVWAKVVAYKASKVFIKNVRIAQLDMCADDFEYPHGLSQAVQRFLNPVGGKERVTPEAKLVLENIMHTYAINPQTHAVVGRFTSPEDAAKLLKDDTIVVSSEDDIAEKMTLSDMAKVITTTTGKEVKKLKDKPTGAKKVAAALEAVKVEAPKAAGRTEKVYAIKEGADFSKRRGGFRLTLDAIVALNAEKEPKPVTAHAIHAWVCQHKPDYKFGDIYSDISMARRYGFLAEGEDK